MAAPALTVDDLAVLYLEVEVGWERAQSRFVRFQGFDAAWTRAEADIARAHAAGIEVDGATVWDLIGDGPEGGSEPDAPPAPPADLEPAVERLAPVTALRPRGQRAASASAHHDTKKPTP